MLVFVYNIEKINIIILFMREISKQQLANLKQPQVDSSKIQSLRNENAELRNKNAELEKENTTSE